MEKRQMLKRLLKNRKGTAEVIGSVMFIVILLFFFTNVYLWHDAATKDMNELYVKKMNAGMDLNLDAMTVTAKGSDAILSRFWIVTESGQHFYANLEDHNIHLMAGKPVNIILVSQQFELDGSITADWINGEIVVHYPSTDIAKLSVVNTLGIVV
jgi:hypothetical protein